MFLRTAAAFLAIATLGANASFTKIAGYEPNSQVTDHNALDLDQKALESALGEDQQSSYDNAIKVYENGGNSGSYAAISITLTKDVAAGAAIKGTSVDGGLANGKAYAAAKAGDTMIWVRYSTSDEQENHVKCKVGGLSEGDQVTGGCLAASGKLDVDGTEYNYSYDVSGGNKNGRTIQTLSTEAESTMSMCANGCPYPEFKKYSDYFGSPDYADKWVMAGLKGEKVDYSGKSFDFSKYGFSGRKEVSKKGTVYFNFYMYIISRLYDAIEDCKLGCDECNEGAAHAWDEAVAFYTGSLEGTSGRDQSSKLLHELADKRCQNFGTCGENGDMSEGNAHVNFEIFNYFKQGQSKLSQSKCDEAAPFVDKIIAIMAVPMVQGALRYAWRVAYEDDNLEKKNAEGVTFATAVLPRIHACDSSAADTILEEMQVAGPGEYSNNFPEVKAAFESVYDCMGITCAQIGGLLASDGTYNDFAEPCGGDSSPASSKTMTVALATILGAVANFL
jgi:hypothetical protein